MTVTSGNLGAGCFTKTLTSANLTIVKEMGFSSISIGFVSGTVTITGDRYAAGTAPDAITLSSSLAGASFVIESGAIDGLLINASSGVCTIIAQ